jgi:ubiquinone/menaquinone biosynthesis C-methylase UbiE
MGDPQGLAFDPIAEDYDRGRPGWPAGVLDGVEGEVVLDLAAGTGKLTRLLVDRYPTVVAVEPSAGMRAVLRERVPEAQVLQGAAESIPVDDASIDAVFVAEAFHWFDPESAGAELRRVVRAGGTVVACFNEPAGRDETFPPEARQALEEILSTVPPTGAAKVATGAWKAAFAGDCWTPLEESVFAHEATFDREAMLAAVVSFSSIAQLPAERREEIRSRLRELLPDRAATQAFSARVFRTVRL